MPGSSRCFRSLSGSLPQEPTAAPAARLDHLPLLARMSLLEDLFVGDVRQGGILPRLRALEAEVALQGQAAAEAQGVKPRMEALEGLLRDQGRLPCEGQQAREAAALDAGRAAAAALEVPWLAVAVPHALELAPDREADEGSGAAEPEVPKLEPVTAERSGGCPQESGRGSRFEAPYWPSGALLVTTAGRGLENRCAWTPGGVSGYLF